MVSHRRIPAVTSAVPQPSNTTFHIEDTPPPRRDTTLSREDTASPRRDTTLPRVAALRTKPPRHHIHRPPFHPVITFDNKIVFSFFRFDDVRVREVVSIRDITEDGKNPSWGKLVEILSAKQIDGISVFDEKTDMMLFDQLICVQEERQFISAVQWMSNTGGHSRNVHIPIYDAGIDTRLKLWPKQQQAACPGAGGV